MQVKNHIFKWIGGIAAVVLSAAVLLAGRFIYVTRYKITDIDSAISPNGEYSVIYQNIGEPDFPFGYTHVRLVLRKGKESVSRYKFDVANDGGMLSPEQWAVDWKADRVEVTVSGEEQPDNLYTLYYDGGTDWTELDTEFGEWKKEFSQ